MEYFGITDRGCVRKNNQDMFLCEDIRLIDSVLLIVCDGMGGAKSGNIASKMAAETFRDTLLANLDLFGDSTSLAEQMKFAAEKANEVVYDRSNSDESCSGMGTTIVAAVLNREEATVVNVGDSRAYLISRTEGIRQITTDHSVVEQLVLRGDITRDEARKHPNKNLITRAIGTSDRVLADTFCVRIKEGDRLLLCSDGLSNVIAEEQLAYEALKTDNMTECCENFIKAAIDLGAPDNVTAVIIRI